MHRPIERINNFLILVNVPRVINQVWNLKELDPSEVYARYRENRRIIGSYWMENPHLRFSQVLVSLNIIPNIPGFWYNMEDSEVLELSGYNPESVNYWGVAMNKDGSLKPVVEYKIINDLETDHLRSIVDKGYVDKNPKYKKIMQSLILKRSGLL